MILPTSSMNNPIPTALKAAVQSEPRRLAKTSGSKLAINRASEVSWRAARTKAQCEDTQVQTAQGEVKDSAAYDCLYKTARLTFSDSTFTWTCTPPERHLDGRVLGEPVRKPRQP